MVRVGKYQIWKPHYQFHLDHAKLIELHKEEMRLQCANGLDQAELIELHKNEILLQYANVRLLLSTPHAAARAMAKLVEEIETRVAQLNQDQL